MRLIFSMILCGALMACGQGVTPAAVKTTTPIAYSLDTGGIALVGRSQRVDFGRTDHSTERAMTKLVGQGPVSREICADGRPKLVWADGTILFFERGAFRGWSKRGADGALQSAGRTCG